MQIKGMAKFYPKVYCTETHIDHFLLYLPFTLLLVPIILTGIEKTYVLRTRFVSLVVKIGNFPPEKVIHT